MDDFTRDLGMYSIYVKFVQPYAEHIRTGCVK